MGVATVHGDNLSSQVAGAQQDGEHDFGHLCGGTEAASGDVAYQLRSRSSGSLRNGYDARGNGVDSHCGGQLCSKGASQSDDAGLGGQIGRVVGPAPVPAGVSQVDDIRASCGNRETGDFGGGKEIHREEFLPVCPGHSCQWPPQIDPGAVDQRVDFAMFSEPSAQFNESLRRPEIDGDS